MRNCAAMPVRTRRPPLTSTTIALRRTLMKKHLHAVTLLCGLLSMGGSALAHGDEDHAASGAATGHQHSGAGHSHAGADAIGVAGQAGKVNRTVNVDMTDNMRFNPSSLSVKQGETIRFVVKNSGKVKHEMVL